VAGAIVFLLLVFGVAAIGSLATARSVIFFGLQQPGWALAVLWAAGVAYAAQKISEKGLDSAVFACYTSR